MRDNSAALTGSETSHRSYRPVICDNRHGDLLRANPADKWASSSNVSTSKMELDWGRVAEWLGCSCRQVRAVLCVGLWVRIPRTLTKESTSPKITVIIVGAGYPIFGEVSSNFGVCTFGETRPWWQICALPIFTRSANAKTNTTKLLS